MGSLLSNSGSNLPAAIEGGEASMRFGWLSAWTKKQVTQIGKQFLFIHKDWNGEKKTQIEWCSVNYPDNWRWHCFRPALRTGAQWGGRPHLLALVMRSLIYEFIFSEGQSYLPAICLFFLKQALSSLTRRKSYDSRCYMLTTVKAFFRLFFVFWLVVRMKPTLSSHRVADVAHTPLLHMTILG